MFARHRPQFERLRACRVKRRVGAVAFEALFVLPLFSMIVVGTVGLGDLLVAEQLLSEASARGARTAALGGTDEQIRDAVRAVLGPQRAERANIFIFPVSDPPAGNNSEGLPKDSDGRPNGTADEKWHCRPGELIEVRVQLEAQYATATQFCPVGSHELLVGRAVFQCE